MRQTVRYFLIALVAITVMGTVALFGLMPRKIALEPKQQGELAEKNQPNETEQKEQQEPRIKATDNDLDLLARVVHAEAKGESFEGQVAVAAVILNRVDHPQFPNTISGVIYEPHAFETVTIGTINQPAGEPARKAAQEAIWGTDPTHGAIYFFNAAKTSNRWIHSRPVVKVIGKHTFAT